MKKFLTIMIAAILALGMMACGGKDKTPENGGLSEESVTSETTPIFSQPTTGVSDGFHVKSYSEIFIAYHFDEESFDADNVEIELYYGSCTKSCPSGATESMQENNVRYSMGVVFMNWGNYNLVHKNDDRFPPEIFDELSIGVSSNYAYVLRRHTITEFWNKNYYTVCDSEKGLVFTHKETLTIPQELLTDEEGLLTLSVWESNYTYGEDGTEKRTSSRYNDVYLRYKWADGKIVLSLQVW